MSDESQQQADEASEDATSERAANAEPASEETAPQPQQQGLEQAVAPAQQPPAPVPWHKVVILALLLLPVTAIIVMFGPEQNAPLTTNGLTTTPQADTTGAVPSIPELQTQPEQEFMRREEKQRHATAKARLLLFLPHEDRAKTLIAEAQEEVDRWQSEIVPLRTNEKGKHLAASDEGVLTYHYLMRKPRPPLTQSDALRESLAALYEPIKLAISEDRAAHELPEDVRERLTDITGAAISIADEYRNDRGIIEGLIAKSSERSEQTVQERLAELAAVSAGKVAKELAALQTAVAEEEKQKNLDQAAEILRTQAAAERERQKVAADIDLKKITDETERIKADADKERRIARAKSDEVKKKLAPFITEGWMSLFGVGAKARLPEKQPVSFNDLKTSGALDPGLKGVAMICYIASKPDEDRPRWSYVRTGFRATNVITIGSSGTNAISEEDLATIREAQTLLRELGPVMVELGMLAP